MLLRLCLLVAFCVAFLPATAQATTINLIANMDCVQANAGAGTCGAGGTGTGTATITLDDGLIYENIYAKGSSTVTINGGTLRLHLNHLLFSLLSLLVLHLHLFLIKQQHRFT